MSDALALFADSTTSRGRTHEQIYILAVVPMSADVSWVSDVRQWLVVEEVKHKTFLKRREDLKAETLLWRKIDQGIGDATIILRSAKLVVSEARRRSSLDERDWRQRNVREAILEQSARKVLGDTALVGLRDEIMRVFPHFKSTDRLTPHYTDPEVLTSHLGGRLDHSLALAARSDMIADVIDAEGAAKSIAKVVDPSQGLVGLTRVLEGIRLFDRELPRTLTPLKMQAQDLAEMLDPFLSAKTATIQIEEADSASSDYLQAADMAAGEARTMIDQHGPESLPSRFRKVWFNGIRLFGTADIVRI